MEDYFWDGLLSGGELSVLGSVLYVVFFFLLCTPRYALKKKHLGVPKMQLWKILLRLTRWFGRRFDMKRHLSLTQHLQLHPTKTTHVNPCVPVVPSPPMMLSAAPPVASSEEVGSSLKDAKAEDILKGLKAMSPEDRKKVEDALKIVEKDMMAKVARTYKCSSGNGDWGDYEMQVGLGF